MIIIKYARYSLKRKQAPLFIWLAIFILGAVIGGLVTARIARKADSPANPSASSGDMAAEIAGEIWDEEFALDEAGYDPESDAALSGDNGGNDIVASDAARSPDLADVEIVAGATSPASGDEFLSSDWVIAAWMPSISEDESPAEGSADVSAYGKPLLAIVLDDVGYSLSQAVQINSLDLPLTWTIIPGLRYSIDVADMLTRVGVPYLAHIPMQALGDKDGLAGHNGLKSDYLIGVGMEESVIRGVLSKQIAALPGLIGVSNHRGSKATSDQRTMNVVMDTIKGTGLIFLDSHTSPKTVAYDTARSLGVPTAKNSQFLDNVAEPPKVSAAMDRAMSIAERNGWAIAICHPRPGTIEFLEEFSRRDKSALKVSLVTLPQLMKELGKR